MLSCFGCKHRKQKSREADSRNTADSIVKRASDDPSSGQIKADGNGVRSGSPSAAHTLAPVDHPAANQPGSDRSCRGSKSELSAGRRRSVSRVSDRISYASARSDSFESVVSFESHEFTSITHELTSINQGRQDERDSTSIESLVRSAEAAHAEGRLLQVQHYLQRAAEARNSSWQQLLHRGILAETGVHSTLDMQQVQRAVEELHSCLKAAHDTADFDVSSSDDVSIMYRHRKGDAEHSFRFEAIYDCPVSHLMAITREFDLLSSWNKYAKDSAILDEPSTLESVLYTAQWMPFPMTELDLVVHSQWSDLLEEEGALVIALRDYSQEIPSPGVDALPPRSTKRRRIQLLPGSASIIQPYPCTADGRPRSRCLVVAALDPHIDFVPQFMITFVLKVLSPFLYNAAKRMLVDSFSSPDMQLPRRMAACPQVYQLIDERFRSPPHGSEPPPAVGTSMGKYSQDT